MVTLKEIAEICNVSATTVSNVINGKAKTSEETKNRILTVIKETGYKPNYMAQGLRAKRTKVISIVAEDIAQFTCPAIIESIMAQCEKRDYHVFVHNLRLYDRWSDTWYNQDEAYHSVLDPVLQDVLSARVDGVIYLAGHTRIINCFNDDFAMPAVMCYAFSNSPSIPSVVIEDEKSACEVVTHLIKNGHKRIGFVGGRSENIHTGQRLLGYQRALFENGLLFDPNLVYYGDWSRESGYEGAKALLPQGVTAFFGISDKMSGGIYDYLMECGLKIGEDIAVAGFDNESISEYFYPPLTTTALPLTEIGRISADLLIDMLEQEDPTENIPDEPQVISVPCSMVFRKSVSKR
ncbi:LacI family DNA-binding transcriptional regulator [Butyrivibrio sp. AE3006]|uniref:LacI family DNA-binding transcriptional regulator n=1 Tax=Butyrivibrio sp. AE3006 TaxID=1280673 RepID=UPI0003FB0AAD|nr:LacI family DNA-binding transcriptional regulator [Butyrivibrio sp. AE3006]